MTVEPIKLVNPLALSLPKSRAQRKADKKRELQCACDNQLRRALAARAEGVRQEQEFLERVKRAAVTAGIPMGPVPQAPTAKPKRKPRRVRR